MLQRSIGKLTDFNVFNVKNVKIWPGTVTVFLTFLLTVKTLKFGPGTVFLTFLLITLKTLTFGPGPFLTLKSGPVFLTFLTLI